VLEGEVVDLVAQLAREIEESYVGIYVSRDSEGVVRRCHCCDYRVGIGDLDSVWFIKESGLSLGNGERTEAARRIGHAGCHEAAQCGTIVNRSVVIERQ
jgi:hypothetical protein